MKKLFVILLVLYLNGCAKNGIPGSAKNNTDYQTAQFNNPIVYSDQAVKKIFYIADANGKLIPQENIYSEFVDSSSASFRMIQREERFRIHPVKEGYNY